MTPFAGKYMRMNPIIILMVMNHRAEAHTTYTVAFRYIRTKTKITEANSQPKNTHSAFQ